MSEADLVPVERIGRAIRMLRGQRVLLDADLASLYGTTTKKLNQQVRRNVKRFPEDFAFWRRLRPFTGRSRVFGLRSPARRWPG